MRLTKKMFTRDTTRDFRDDGTTFRFYNYKDVLPITVATWKSCIFLSIRLDYLGFRFEEYKEDHKILNMFNGVGEDKFDAEKLIENCEFIAKKYNLM